MSNPVRRRLQTEYGQNRSFRIDDFRDLAEIFTPRRKLELNVPRVMADNFASDANSLTMPSTYPIIQTATCNFFSNFIIVEIFFICRQTKSSAAAATDTF
jgi:hypothetical protein